MLIPASALVSDAALATAACSKNGATGGADATATETAAANAAATPVATGTSAVNR